MLHGYVLDRDKPRMLQRVETGVGEERAASRGVAVRLWLAASGCTMTKCPRSIVMPVRAEQGSA